MRLNILLLEDKIADGQEIEEIMNDIFAAFKARGILKTIGVEDVNIHWEKGRKNKGKKYRDNRFYDEGVLPKIATFLRCSEEGEKNVLLLDMVLTKDDLDNEERNIVSGLELTKEICSCAEKSGNSNLFFITSVVEFDAKVSFYLERDCGDRIIHKYQISPNPSERMIYKMLYYYVKGDLLCTEEIVQKLNSTNKF